MFEIPTSSVDGMVAEFAVGTIGHEKHGMSPSKVDRWMNRIDPLDVECRKIGRRVVTYLLTSLYYADLHFVSHSIYELLTKDVLSIDGRRSENDVSIILGAACTFAMNKLEFREHILGVMKTNNGKRHIGYAIITSMVPLAERCDFTEVGKLFWCQYEKCFLRPQNN